jgi:hypothetical protein
MEKLKLTSMMFSITNEHDAINRVITSIKSDNHRLFAKSDRNSEVPMKTKRAEAEKTVCNFRMRKLPKMLAMALTRKMYAKWV